MKNEILQLKFEKGNILIQTKTKHPFLEQFNWLNYDLRTQSYRCFGYYYKDLILALQKNLDYKDSIKAYQELSLKLDLPFESYSYQKEAMKKWSEQKRGILVLPTGSGKSILAAMIMEKINRSTLVLVPTIELLIQWHKNLKEYFSCKIGMLGGGSKEIEPITVSTYDSARIYHEKLGNTFCLITYTKFYEKTNLRKCTPFLSLVRLSLCYIIFQKKFYRFALKSRGFREKISIFLSFSKKLLEVD